MRIEVTKVSLLQRRALVRFVLWSTRKSDISQAAQAKLVKAKKIFERVRQLCRRANQPMAKMAMALAIMIASSGVRGIGNIKGLFS